MVADDHMEIEMIRQIATKTTTTAAVIRTAAFARGFNEVKKGKPLEYDAFPYDANKQWDYERGRQFALLFNGAIKKGAKVTYAAELMFGIELHRKSII
jgi:hypothetical protein